MYHQRSRAFSECYAFSVSDVWEEFGVPPKATVVLSYFPEVEFDVKPCVEGFSACGTPDVEDALRQMSADSAYDLVFHLVHTSQCSHRQRLFGFGYWSARGEGFYIVVLPFCVSVDGMV